LASVKWLRQIRALETPFEGVQQALAYNYQQSEEDPGTPVTRKHSHALMILPGIPDFLSRKRHLKGRKGHDRRPRLVRFRSRRTGRVQRHGGESWRDADLGYGLGPHGWTSWSSEWEASPGEYELCVRATDASGEIQPLDGEQAWNQGGYGINVVQRVLVQVGYAKS